DVDHWPVLGVDRGGTLRAHGHYCSDRSKRPLSDPCSGRRTDGGDPGRSPADGFVPERPPTVPNPERERRGEGGDSRRAPADGFVSDRSPTIPNSELE